MPLQSNKKKEKILFGTDGIRGIANHYPMTPEIAVKTGRAAVDFCRRQTAATKPKVVIGRDTRISGQMIECALISGVCSMGGDVFSTGILPTPGVACIIRHLNADAGIVVSASHNPFYDNGIKFFNHKGFKLSDEEEALIENYILGQGDGARTQKSHHDIGRVHQLADAQSIYANFLKASVRHASVLDGLKVAMDCSNGATFEIAPRAFSDLGAYVLPIAASPNGININDRCGSQHPDFLAKRVIESQSDLGVAFDGDGDRLIAVDETGAILSGDQILAAFAQHLSKNGMLENRTVVSTVMSNIGLRKALAAMDIQHIMVNVGDRYVMEQMLASDSILGGEDSGHMILLKHHTTGDGVLAAIQLAAIIRAEGLPLSKLAEGMTVYPQKLMNVEVQSKPDLAELPEINNVIASVEKALSGNGRVLVRYSGTQSVCRVMVEASTTEDAGFYCKKIAEVIKRHLGGPFAGNK